MKAAVGCGLCLMAWGAVASPALDNVIDAAGMARLLAGYTNNVLAVAATTTNEWDVSNSRRLVDRLPANMACQLAVGAAPDDRRAAEAAIAAATNAMPPHVRGHFSRLHVMAPLLQRIIRRCRPGVTNENVYVTKAAHPAVWRAKDFDLGRIEAYARNLMSNDVPLVVSLRPVYGEYRESPITRAVPGLDYSDPRPEVTYETPYGAAIVLRARENRRKFRFYATAWPVNDAKVTFKWVPLSTLSTYGISVQPFQWRRQEYPMERGFGEITLNWSLVRGRQDVAVFARYGDGPWGPPSVISFCVVPNEKRTYDREGRIVRMEHVPMKEVWPQIFQNKPWKDEFEISSFGHVVGFRRLRTGSVREELFTIGGEAVAETYAGDQPKVTNKVRYFTREDDPATLDYEVTDEEVRYPLQSFVPRGRGEFPVLKAIRRK